MENQIIKGDCLEVMKGIEDNSVDLIVTDPPYGYSFMGKDWDKAVIPTTVKPLKLMSYLITLGSREGDLVLDPFVGSGTTCVACKQLNRRFIGIDNNSEYVKIVKARLEAVQPSLFASWSVGG